MGCLMSKPNTQEEVEAVASKGNTKSLYDVDVNKIDGRTGKTKLRLAVDNDDYDWCKGLVDSGANVNIKDNKGVTAVMRAVERGRGDIVKVLLQGGLILTSRAYAEEPL